MLFLKVEDGKDLMLFLNIGGFGGEGDIEWGCIYIPLGRIKDN